MPSFLNGLSDTSDDGLDARTQAPPPDVSADPGLNRIEAGPRANHMAEADAEMGLLPEEKFLYNTHLLNLNGPGKIVHPNGAISSLLQMSFERDGNYYNIPTVYAGRQLAPDDAIKAAEQIGLDRFPSHGSEDEAEARYTQLHDFLGRDTADFSAGAKGKGQ